MKKAVRSKEMVILIVRYWTRPSSVKWPKVRCAVKMDRDINKGSKWNTNNVVFRSKLYCSDTHENSSQVACALSKKIFLRTPQHHLSTLISPHWLSPTNFMRWENLAEKKANPKSFPRGKTGHYAQKFSGKKTPSAWMNPFIWVLEPILGLW